MKKGNHVVFGIFKSRATVEMAVNNLKSGGFRTDDISVLLPKGSDSDDFALVKESKAPEGSAAGAGTGIVLGGALGWLAGAGALALTGIGPLIAAGPIMATLAGIGVGGTLGGIAGGLIGLGIPEYEAIRYEGRVKQGGILLSVHADDMEWVEKAEDILEASNAEDVSVSKEVADENLESRKPSEPKEMNF